MTGRDAEEHRGAAERRGRGSPRASSSPCSVRTRLIPSRGVCRQGRRRPRRTPSTPSPRTCVSSGTCPRTRCARICPTFASSSRRPAGTDWPASAPTPSATGCARSTATTERTSIARKLVRRARLLPLLLAHERSSPHDPTSGIATPKMRRTLPAHLTLDDVDRLLSAPRRRHAARPARSRDPRAAVLLRAARVAS